MIISFRDPKINLYLFTLLISGLGFILGYITRESVRFNKFLDTKPGELRFIIFQRWLGVFFFGFIPLIVVLFSEQNDFSAFGLINPGFQSIIWTGFLSLFIIPISYLNSRTQSNLEIYPQIRLKEWSLSILILSAVSWTAYLIAYEFMFRGVLFFFAVPLIGFWPALLVNILVYSLFHIPKGYKETLGAIPFGVILCVVTVKTGNIWIAIFAHIILALSTEWFSLFFHPQIRLTKFNK